MISMPDETHEPDWNPGEAIRAINEADLRTINFVSIVKKAGNLRSLHCTVGDVGKPCDLRAVKIPDLNIGQAGYLHTIGAAIRKIDQARYLDALRGREVYVC